MQTMEEQVEVSLGRLKQVQKEALSKCEEKIQQLEKIQSSYEVVKSQLETLVDKITHRIMVPVGSVAFFPGLLMHTNEVMVLLGDNWFAMQSAKQAADIASRRIQSCETTLVDLRKEKQHIKDWMKHIIDVEESDLVEIVEKYDAAKEDQWRKQHKENMRLYHQKLREEQEQQRQIDGDPLHQIWKKLEEEEILEDQNREMFSVNTRSGHGEKGSVSCTELRKVRWKDEEPRQSLTIHFTHSSNESGNQDKEIRILDSNIDASRQNPGDLLKLFCKVPSKPCLKIEARTPNVLTQVSHVDEKVQQDCLTAQPTEPKVEAFTGKVVEMQNALKEPKSSSSRRASKFKMESSSRH